MSKKIGVKIRGTCDYVQHKRPVEKRDTSKQSRVDRSEGWKELIYVDPEIGCYFPSWQIKLSLMHAGKDFKNEDQMGKTFRDLIDATVEIEPNKISLNRNGTKLTKPDYIYEYGGCGCIGIPRNQTRQGYPAFKKDWEAEFILLVMNGYIAPNRLKEILECVGSFYGIGDQRPKFGRFEIIEFYGLMGYDLMR